MLPHRPTLLLTAALVLVSFTEISPAQDRRSITGKVIALDYDAKTITIKNARQKITLRVLRSTEGLDRLEQDAHVTVIYSQAAGEAIKVLSSRPGDDGDQAVGGMADGEAPDGQDGRRPGPKPPNIEQLAQGCATAKEALQLYQAYLRRADVSPRDRDVAQRRLAYWETAAQQGLARLGKKWLLETDVVETRQRANQVAEDGFQILKLGNARLSLEKLSEASRLDPDSSVAIHWLGLLQSIDGDTRNALRSLKECLARSPGDVSILNNLALTEFRARKYEDAALHWQQAARLDLKCRQIAQNILKLNEIYNEGTIRLPRRVLTIAGETFAEMQRQGEVPVMRNRQWFYMAPPTPRAWLKDAINQPANEQAPAHNLFVMDSGTGFVVAPGYILTNEHVVEDGERFRIVALEDNRPLSHAATLVAVSKDHDLALLRVDTFTAPPLPLRRQPVELADEVMCLGYPLTNQIGTTMKSTRGIISGLPEPHAKTGMLSRIQTDAIIAPGNSGGPVLDAHGHVMGVATALTPVIVNHGDDIEDPVGSYGLLEPTTKVLEFLKAHGIECPIANQREAQPWKDTVREAAASVVRVQCLCDSLDFRIKGIKSDPFELHICMACNNRVFVDCPVKGCSRGKIHTQVTRVIGKNPQTGGDILRRDQVMTPCKTCDGQGRVICTACPPGQQIVQDRVRNALTMNRIMRGEFISDWELRKLLGF